MKYTTDSWILQQLTVGCSFAMLLDMNRSDTEKERREFGERLNYAFEIRNIPSHKRNSLLRKWTNTGNEGCRKWLTGQSIPLKPRIKEIAYKLSVNESWLEYGVGTMVRDLELSLEDQEADQILALVRRMLLDSDKELRDDLKRFLQIYDRSRRQEN